MNFILPDGIVPFCFYGIHSTAYPQVHQDRYIVEIIFPKNHPDLDLMSPYFFDKYPLDFMNPQVKNIAYFCSSFDIIQTREIILTISKQIHDNKVPKLRILALKAFVKEMKSFLKNQANVYADDIRQFL